MSPSRQWHVLVTNDEVNSHAGMVYILHRVCGMSPDAALLRTMAIESAGNAEVATVPSRDHAEALAAELHLFGVHVSVREA